MMKQMEEMFELLTRILCDIHPPERAEGAFLFGQTTDNQASVFARAYQLLEQRLISKILLIETGAKSGYPGFAAWREQLLALKIKEAQIQGVEIAETPALNTLIEAQALVQFAKQQGLAILVIVAAPFHQTRAFMTAVTVANREYPSLRIYSCPGAVLPWHKEVSHSQGTTRGTRKELIKTELDRIEKYQKKGDLASFEEVLSYLNRRDP